MCLCVVWLRSCYKFVYKSSHRWLYRACGPHSNTVCHTRNTASRSLSLKRSLIHSLRMHVSSIQCQSFQVRSTSKTAWSAAAKQTSAVLFKLKLFRDLWKSFRSFSPHSFNLSFGCSPSLSFSNVSSIITGSVGS